MVLMRATSRPERLPPLGECALGGSSLSNRLGWRGAGWQLQLCQLFHITQSTDFPSDIRSRRLSSRSSWTKERRGGPRARPLCCDTELLTS
ncbi:hypothetical protein ATANTOWER_005731 [Ataeniobius toweri]|uniref:Uncharacterized protein n=1 Tax=Ataeniobius toweri TaxID=208326 RepID=A0ABU7BMY6_9TELE|nr:hypothetical protein [Ataeniobius toweri]